MNLKKIIICGSLMVFAVSCQKGESNNRSYALKSATSAEAINVLAHSHDFDSLVYQDDGVYELYSNNEKYDLQVLEANDNLTQLEISLNGDVSIVLFDVNSDYITFTSPDGSIEKIYDWSGIATEANKSFVGSILGLAAFRSGTPTLKIVYINPPIGISTGKIGWWYCVKLAKNDPGCDNNKALLEAKGYCGGTATPSLGPPTTSCLWENHFCITTRKINC